MHDVTEEVPTHERGTAPVIADGRPQGVARRRDHVRVLLAGREMEALHEQLRAAAPRVECVLVPGAAAA